MDAYPYLKALHLIAVVSWFAGLLYIVRLFINHVEAAARPEAERKVLEAQFSIMERRLWYVITWPACIAAAIFGVWLMVLTRAYESSWFHLKLGLLALLIGYHLGCGRIRKDLAAGACRLTSKQLRIWNEVATLLLFGIIFTAVLKSPLAAGKAMGWVVLVSGIGVGILAVRRRRSAKASRRASGDGRRASGDGRRA